MVAVVGKVHYILLQTLATLLPLPPFDVLQCSGEPSVKLRFYDFSVFHFNVKEHIVTLGNNSRVTLGCDVEGISPDTEGSIVLTNGKEVIHNSSISDSRSLVWTGVLSASMSSDLRCHVDLNKGNIKAKVTMSGVKLLHGIQAKACLPTPTDGPYLQNEIISTFCFSGNNAQWISNDGTNETLLSSPMITGRIHHASATRFVRNYVKLNVHSPILMACRSRSDDSRKYCDINTTNLNIEKTLMINITLNRYNTNHSSTLVYFSCETNVPTEHIKWRAETKEAYDILDLSEEGVDNRPNFSISHSLKSSNLSFPDEEIGLIAISCFTTRAGYIATATWRNAFSAYTSENYEHILVYAYLITIIAILSVLSLTSSFCLAYVIIKRRKAE